MLLSILQCTRRPPPTKTCPVERQRWRNTVFFFFFKFIYLFGARERQGEGETETQAGTTLSMQSLTRALKPRTVRP